MFRRTFFLLSLTGLLVGAVAIAQPGDSSKCEPATVAQVTLGQSATPLYGPWKFTVGDSPLDAKTGKPLWAEPGFDDSKWETVDLTPKDGSSDPSLGTSGYVPGWTTQGHPNYSGYAWYRIRVSVQGRPDAGLALAGPADVDDAYQLFEGGEFVGQFGDFGGKKPVAYFSRPRMFPLGKADSRDPGAGPGDSTRVLAFRVWMQASDLVTGSDSGGMHAAPVLGETHAVAAGHQVRWLDLIRAYASAAVQALVFGMLAVVTFTLILFDRSDRVYLWMGALFLLTAADASLLCIGAWTELQSVPVNTLLEDGFTQPLIYAVWVMVFWVWFGLQRPSWLPRITAGLTLLLMVSNILGDEVFFGVIPHAVAVHFATVSLVLHLLFFALLLWVVIAGIRRKGMEGWVVLLLVVLRGIGMFTVPLEQWNIRIDLLPFGADVNLSILSSLLVAVVISLLLLRRLLQSVQRQRLMALDVKQAQEVQQVILPEARLTLPGLSIESEYRPAREVGGDFFQIIPHKTDGSVLIVAGDVTGKGLKAGMMVALLVGAVRMAAEISFDPQFLMQALNRRLVGRADAQATCLALLINADGSVVLANAGHMAPYLNGEALPMEGALPLGMIDGAEPSVMHFSLKSGDRLLVMSDGIAEATDGNGQLFGFERVNALVKTAKSAAEVAEAAQRFGQEDDISVIAVERTGVKSVAA